MKLIQLIDNLNSAAKAWSIENSTHNASPSTKASEKAERAKLLAAARGLVSALEVPQTSVLEMSKGPAGHAALRTALMMKVFDDWAREEVKTAGDLAKQTVAEETLVVRIMRVLVSLGIFEERAESTYAHNALSQTMIDSTFRQMIVGMCASASLTMGKLPEYLASLNFRNPSDPENALFHYAVGTKLNMFQWLKTQPEALALFGASNAAATKIQGRSLQDTISGLFPNKSTAPTNGVHVEGDQVLLVDVGAGHGQALKDVRAERPDLVGRMIAQDLPEVIAARPVAEGVENMAHSFFDPQPVKGASTYFFSHIFHDWPDVACRKILHAIIPAMTPNYSRIVIVDQVLPKTGAAAISALLDLNMIAFGAMERSERQWRELLEGVGLSVVRIDGPKDEGSLARDGTVEAILKG